MTSLRQAGIEVGIALVVAGLLFGTGYLLGTKHETAKAVQVQTEANQHEGAALDHAAQASQIHQQAQAQDTAVQSADAKVQAAKRAYSAAVHPSETQRPLSSPASLRADGASVPGLPLSPASGDTQLALAKADEVISAQDDEIKALKLKASLAQAEADQWHNAYNESQKALSLQRIAMEAAVSSERHKGWIHTFGGLALGFAAGRAR